jgi:hypothetical protein
VRPLERLDELELRDRLEPLADPPLEDRLLDDRPLEDRPLEDRPLDDPERDLFDDPVRDLLDEPDFDPLDEPERVPLDRDPLDEAERVPPDREPLDEPERVPPDEPLRLEPELERPEVDLLRVPDEEPVRARLLEPELLVERDREDDPRELLWRERLPSCFSLPDSSSLSESLSPRSFLPTPTAAAVARPTAAPVITFFGVDMPSSSPFAACSVSFSLMLFSFRRGPSSPR